MTDISIGVHSFRKNPVEIQAIQLTWTNWNAVCDFVPKPWFVKGVWLDKDGNPLPDGETNMQPSDNTNLGLIIKTLESQEFLAKGNDWIVRGVEGEFYACKDSIFRTTYEVADQVEAKAVCSRCGGTMKEFVPHVCPSNEVADA